MSGVYADAMHQPIAGGVTRELIKSDQKYLIQERYAPDENMFTPFDTQKPGWSAKVSFDRSTGKGTPTFDKDGHPPFDEEEEDFEVKAVFEPNLKMIQWMTPEKETRHMENVWLEKTLYYPSVPTTTSSIADLLSTIAFSSAAPIATIHTHNNFLE